MNSNGRMVRFDELAIFLLSTAMIARDPNSRPVDGRDTDVGRWTWEYDFYANRSARHRKKNKKRTSPDDLTRFVFWSRLRIGSRPSFAAASRATYESPPFGARAAHASSPAAASRCITPHSLHHITSHHITSHRITSHYRSRPWRRGPAASRSSSSSGATGQHCCARFCVFLPHARPSFLRSALLKSDVFRRIAASRSSTGRAA